MDKTKRNVAALGTLTVVAIAVFFWGLYYLLGTAFVRGGMDIHVTMPEGGGLKRGDRALVEGVIIGSVTDVELRGLRQGVVASLRLNQKLDLPVDTRAVVAGDVFGAHTIELHPGTAQRIIEPGDTLRGEIAAALMDEATGLTTNAKEVLRRADMLLSDEAIANVQATARQLPGSATQLRSALLELRAASAGLRRTIAELEGAKTGAGVNTALRHIDESAVQINKAALSITGASDRLTESILSLRSVLGKVDQGNGSLGKLINDTTLYSELSGAAREFRLLAADIRANPKRYVDLRLF